MNDDLLNSFKIMIFLSVVQLRSDGGSCDEDNVGTRTIKKKKEMLVNFIVWPAGCAVATEITRNNEPLNIFLEINENVNFV